MITTHVFDHDARKRSFEIVAERPHRDRGLTRPHPFAPARTCRHLPAPVAHLPAPVTGTQIYIARYVALCYRLGLPDARPCPHLPPPPSSPARFGWNGRRCHVEGQRLEDVVLGGWAYGPPPGSAPVVVIVGGITASPFPFGDGRGPALGGVEAWWPALAGDGLIDLAATTVLCPCWPGNGSTWRGFDGPGSSTRRSRCRAWRTWWRPGWMASAATPPVTFRRRQPRWNGGCRVRGSPFLALSAPDQHLGRA